MTPNGVAQILLFFLLILVFTKPLGSYMARVFQGERTLLHPILRPLEVGLYRLFGIEEEVEMPWTTYALAFVLFSVVGLLLTYILLRLQGHLPWNPQKFGADQMTPDLAFNTAVSFTTNTNWQSYTPESTVSYFSNMVALAMHNWMSAAAGIAVAVAFIRGFARRTVHEIGNFWVDTTRATLYILLPLTFILALLLVWQGVPQNFSPYTKVATVEGSTQLIPQGPVASQEAIKELGTNGGGFFNANSAHPYENPTPLTNLLEMLAIFLIPAALTYTFGKMVGNTRQGWALFAAMSAMFFMGVFVCYQQEQRGIALLQSGPLRLDLKPSSLQPGGNMEGKEMRFGIAATALFATVTTDTSCGAVNAMHDSFTPIGGLVPLVNMMTGEVIFGGVGAGLTGMLIIAVIAVFIAGLMVGRTPEYLGKKIEKYEITMAVLVMLIHAASVLTFTAIASDLPLSAHSSWNRVNGSTTYLGATYNNVNNPGPHGFSEILYAFTSTTNNNGSAFAGLNANTPIYNLLLGLAMWVGRFFMLIPSIAIAGSLARKKLVPATAGTFPTDSSTFVFLLVGTTIIIGALTFFPALALGPFAEQFQLHIGKLF
ncbi:K+-transporting ATPase, KdpA [Chthonomonas calidirosea]|uniref:Potassium-transporting ATPase potassium-binding subunit n=1 Tax=Chthonomonas calidirosea (strain DSM 23976 / ICMP 18418 / T49) TaxID=1303518 RepID=S0EVD3_CHTCT|nr:potassium-transporting ATPase subunit KdpA [Chthonomonas calidirosea]CCW35370.1 K+-transporting ATPase, KdpA [Chthonomonas calidirosea T49]CEK20476.1 K+-transporting ATPase, KdpA [Chthonomonas calidirosea]